jgi:hypothetical protein
MKQESALLSLHPYPGAVQDRAFLPKECLKVGRHFGWNFDCMRAYGESVRGRGTSGNIVFRLRSATTNLSIGPHGFALPLIIAKKMADGLKAWKIGCEYPCQEAH